MELHSNAGAVGSISGWESRSADSWPTIPGPHQEKEDSRAGRKGHVERSMHTVKSTLENRPSKAPYYRPADSFPFSWKRPILIPASTLSLRTRCTNQLPTSVAGDWAQHQESWIWKVPGTATDFRTWGQENSSTVQGCKELHTSLQLLLLVFCQVYIVLMEATCVHDMTLLYSFPCG